MKAVSVVTIRKELKYKSKEELAELCLRLSRFKKENKELLTYLLFEADSEDGYIETVKSEIDEQFELINTSSYFYIKKSARKILRTIRKYIRYSLNKETEVVLLLYYCEKLKAMQPSIFRNTTLTNLFDRNVDAITKKIEKLHEDLQYDYTIILEALKD
ncbi:hypothetical protein [Psychroserpens sp.]|uniref:hypothetical protein n=1 Tax=Psychroserpens sp. TaxID=2020870 RepID=UPI001B274F57|nr:hypothetical protein [Psychroserpens sp.]MBO6607444.1 hypothetical protein [Psychroserpens sp.]MBO6631777.1 hypothetical protein [Psychroserpens sp.]MBO6654478.1 hypothetical protein [Psychroserpens sp.]MBO6681173.1 hypothetical protein [Psychroserpens sp.]MBO6749870.1 hypothetical protein [Psychroserpens sp.]